MPAISSLSLRVGLAGALSAAALSVPTGGSAHHSYSMFDRSKVITINGSVRVWEMVNPHSYLWVVVKPADGGPDQVWGLEGGGIAALSRAGVTKSAVKPGEKISVDLHPLRDGRTGGMLVKVMLADGKTINMGGGLQQAPAPGAAAAE